MVQVFEVKVVNTVNSGFATNRLAAPFSQWYIRWFTRLLTHRLVRFQVTSPLAYIIAQLYRASPFFLQHMKASINNRVRSFYEKIKNNKIIAESCTGA